MTTAQAVGAVSREAAEWYAIDWLAINRNVRRLQVRIVQATKASRWGKVRALQRLLTHSYSGKVLAVRRVTENNGKKTPGMDQEIWDTPEKKTQAAHALKRRGYQSQPLRRVYIPKSDGKTMRPLGIPTVNANCTRRPATPEAARLGRSAGSGQGRNVGRISSERVTCECRRLQHLHYFRVARHLLRGQR
jgi:N-terminal domain of reverse transcriptase